MQETLAKCRVVAGRRNEDRDCVLAWPCVFCCRNASTLRVAGHAMDHSFACRLAHDPCSIAVPDTAASCCHNCTQRSLAQVVASQSQARAPKAPSGVVEVSDGPNNNKKSTRKTRLKAKSASPPAQVLAADTSHGTHWHAHVHAWVGGEWDCRVCFATQSTGHAWMWIHCQHVHKMVRLCCLLLTGEAHCILLPCAPAAAGPCLLTAC